MDTNVIISQFNTAGPIKVGSLTFKALDSLDNAVEVTGSMRDAEMMELIGIQPTIIRKKPSEPIEGWHVAKLIERYPCFDSSDYAYDNRYYTNYLFSREPITDNRFIEMLKLPHRMNYNLAHEDTPIGFLPIVYYRGEGPTLLVATSI